MISTVFSTAAYFFYRNFYGFEFFLSKLICLAFPMLFREDKRVIVFFHPCTKLWTFFQAQPDKIPISRPDWFSSISCGDQKTHQQDNLQMFPVTSTHSNGVLVSLLSRVSASLPTKPQASCRWGHIKIHCSSSSQYHSIFDAVSPSMKIVHLGFVSETLRRCSS